MPLKAIFKREFRAYFFNPIAYIFIVAFVIFTGIFNFIWYPFFETNEASFYHLNRVFPYILALFIPTITMSMWADEKRQGTEEVLFTLPATDFQIVLGKYLAALCIYGVSVFFMLSFVIVIMYLGNPDILLLMANFLGYFLLGAGMLAAGMVASSLTSSTVVGFILGVIISLLLVIPSPDSVFNGVVGAVIIMMVVGFVLRTITDNWGLIIPACLVLGVGITAASFNGLTGWLDNFFAYVGVFAYFEDFARGVVSLGNILYFLVLASIMLYTNSLILSRRNW